MLSLRSLWYKSVLIILVLSGAAVQAQYVTIPDTIFANWLQNNGYANCLNGNQLDTTCTTLLNTDTLYLANNSISDLWGLQFFKNLVYLNCSGNYLTSLPLLPPNITYLGCYNNRIINLPVLPTSVTYIDCSSNQIDYLPSLPQSLLRLNVDVNNIRTLPPLPSYLKYLICYKNPLDSFPPLPNHLYELTWGGYSIQVLPKLPASLKILSCVNAHLDSLPQLPDSLTVLDCDDNQLYSLPSLPITLTRLSCMGDQLTFIPELPDSLYEFSCSYNAQLSCLPQLKRIVNFVFNHTAITCIPDYGNVTYSNPSLYSIPLCTAGNPNGCQVYTSINNVSDISNLSIYPNPATDKLYIKFTTALTEPTDVRLYAADGKLIMLKTLGAGADQCQMDCNQLASGVYVLRTVVANKEYNFKVVVTR